MKVAAAKNANLPLGRHNAKVVDADKDGIEFELLECDQRGVRLLFKAPKSISPTSRDWMVWKRTSFTGRFGANRRDH